MIVFPPQEGKKGDKSELLPGDGGGRLLSMPFTERVAKPGWVGEQVFLQPLSPGKHGFVFETSLQSRTAMFMLLREWERIAQGS